MSRALVAVVAAAVLAGTAAAHWVTPEQMVAELNAPGARDALGVVSAIRDPKAPRLLVIRVGGGWWRLPAATRRSQAAEWAEHWRHNVPQGVVSVLDAKTDKPVVRYGRRGEVTGLIEKPG